MRFVAILLFLAIALGKLASFSKTFEIDTSSTRTGIRKRKESSSSSEEESFKEFLNSKNENSNGDKIVENWKTFSCPHVKPIMHTGEDIASISPEDISIMAALGDSLSTGKGLWIGTDVDFRGIAFPIGGDTEVNGLITLPNILAHFNDHIYGLSHGMGNRDQLPDYQLNCAVAEAKTSNLFEQTKCLLHRLYQNKKKEAIRDEWLMVIITIGSEQICNDCSSPNYENIFRALSTLRAHLPRAFVVLLGPFQFYPHSRASSILLRERCECLKKLSITETQKLEKNWFETFHKLQNSFDSHNYALFSLVTIPFLVLPKKNVEDLFISKTIHLSRMGHTYAAKWLWNRLITGPQFNLSDSILSVDSYYCPPLDCPYFRTSANLNSCEVLAKNEWIKMTSTPKTNNKELYKSRKESFKGHLWLIICLIILSCFLSVFFFGTIFYRRSLSETRSRFEIVKGV